MFLFALASCPAATAAAPLPPAWLPAQQPAAHASDELARLSAEIAALRRERDADRARLADLEARQRGLLEALDARSAPGSDGGNGRWYDRITIGGYGEIHLNHENVHGGGDQIDNHRFVAYLGYRFSDSIELHSETEFEHSLAGDGADGELALEQLHVDFRLDERWNVRAGRFLTPLGIVNRTHEPTTFVGVERPLFERIVIPSTWSTDGAGLFGALSPTLAYELYVGSSLDGTGFDPIDGIREGRQEGSPGLSEPALSARLDWTAWRGNEGELTLSGWFFGGGLDNGGGGVNPGLDADLRIYGADVVASYGRFDVRAAYALEEIQGAADIGGGVASEIDGWYGQVAYHFGAEGSSGGAHDWIGFVRYDDIDTQKDMPTGVAADPAGRQNEWTVGVSYFPVENLVIKADYQMRDDDGGGLPERANLGLGWSF